MALMIVTGRIGRDPERRYTNGQNPRPFFTLSVADTDSPKSSDPKDTLWWDCIYFPHGDADETNFGNLVRTGALMEFHGSAKKKDPYTGNDGVRRIDLQLKIDRWKVLVFPPKKDEQAATKEQPKEQPKPATKPQPEQTTISQAAPNEDAPFDPDDEVLPF